MQCNYLAILSDLCTSIAYIDGAYGVCVCVHRIALYVHAHLFDTILTRTLMQRCTSHIRTHNTQPSRKRSRDAHLNCNCRHLFRRNTCKFCRFSIATFNQPFQPNTQTNIHTLYTLCTLFNTSLTMLLLICFVIDFECGKNADLNSFSCI